MFEDKSEFLYHTSCEDCGSSDGRAVYKSGSSYCFVCEKYSGEKPDFKPIPLVKINKNMDNSNDKERWNDSEINLPIPDRNISSETSSKFKIRFVLDENGQVIERLYPYTKNGKLVGYKRRILPKDFVSAGDMRSADPFGMSFFPSGGKYLSIVEGEEDALALYEMSGGKSSVISLKSTSGVKKAFSKEVFDYINSFENIILCLDNDEVGKKATKELINILDPKKIKTVQLTLKDPSEYCQQNRRAEFMKQWWASKQYTPEEIVPVSELRGLLKNNVKPECYSTPWTGLNEKTYGLRTGEMWVWTGDTGIGKSAVFYELIPHLLKTQDFNIGVIPLEAPLPEVMQHLASIYLNKPIFLPDVETTDEEILQAEEFLCGDNKLYFIDNFGSLDIPVLLNTIRYMAQVLECKVIFLDHISMVTSDQRYSDERRALDEASTKLKQLTIDADINLHIIAHTNREGKIRGTANIEKVANTILWLERDKKAPDAIKRNTTYFVLDKNRFCGQTGPAFCVLYDSETGRLNEIEWDKENDETSVSSTVLNGFE